jgi:hypothetical protein
MFRSPNNRAIRRSPRVKGERVTHADATWDAFEPDAVPAARFGAWVVLATYDDDHHAVLEFLGTGCGRTIQHAAIVRAATWASSVTALVRVAVTDPGKLGATRLGSGSRK